MKDYLREYYLKNKERLKAKALLRKEDIAHKSMLWRSCPENKERLKRGNAEYRKNNKDKIRDYMRLYMANPEQKKKHLEYVKLKRQKEPSFRIGCNMQNRIWKALRNAIGNTNKPYKKSCKTEELIGCSSQELLQYLQTKYQPGMTDNNYGRWHIDHIVPVSSFDLTNVNEVKKCFHYTNLQPLWAIDNLKKSSKITENEGWFI